MVLYGSSGIGEPAYSGAIYSPDPIVLTESVEMVNGLEAPVVELGLTYDPEPAINYAAIPAWLLLLVGAGLVANWAGMRIGGR